MTNPWPWLIASLVALAVGVGAYYQWDQQRRRPAPPAAAGAASAPPAVAQAPVEASAVQHPIEAAPAREEPLPSLPRVADPEGDLKDALVALFGRSGVFAFLNTDRFVQRVVVTVDNLPRERASTRLWPVQPIGGRFTTAPAADGAAATIAPANAARYDAFVRFVEGIDTARAAALYLRLYPAFQAAYESLGYPGRHFNDRVVAVIDHLIETPELAAPPRVVLTEVKGPHAPARPWVMYEYEDRSLEARSAGQKILLRVGPEHARRLKAKLLELRRRIARGAPAPATTR